MLDWHSCQMLSSSDKDIIIIISEDSDQPGHPPSLIRVFAVHSWIAKDPLLLHADSEDSDQTHIVTRNKFRSLISI